MKILNETEKQKRIAELQKLLLETYSPCMWSQPSSSTVAYQARNFQRQQEQHAEELRKLQS